MIKGRKGSRCLLTLTARLGLVEAAPSTSGTAAAAMIVIAAVGQESMRLIL